MESNKPKTIEEKIQALQSNQDELLTRLNHNNENYKNEKQYIQGMKEIIKFAAHKKFDRKLLHQVMFIDSDEKFQDYLDYRGKKLDSESLKNEPHSFYDEKMDIFVSLDDEKVFLNKYSRITDIIKSANFDGNELETDFFLDKEEHRISDLRRKSSSDIKTEEYDEIVQEINNIKKNLSSIDKKMTASISIQTELLNAVVEIEPKSKIYPGKYKEEIYQKYEIRSINNESQLDRSLESINKEEEYKKRKGSGPSKC